MNEKSRNMENEVVEILDRLRGIKEKYHMSGVSIGVHSTMDDMFTIGDGNKTIHKERRLIGKDREFK